MINKPLFYPLIVIFSLAFLVACSKGDAGPAGPAGPSGPAGPAGPSGPTGTANVIYSDWLDVTFEPNADSSNWNASIPAPALSADILNQGEIKVYINFNTASDPVVFPLPYFDGAVIINPVFFTDTIALVSTVDAGTISDTGGKFFQYRYVLIPGGQLANIPANVNLDKYADVKKYFKLTN
ncbi:MAG TPA: hypothetical protein VM101_01765 [Flavitalea sp.]|nr:hypothetical protein [Flavitalea sp.]